LKKKSKHQVPRTLVGIYKPTSTHMQLYESYFY